VLGFAAISSCGDARSETSVRGVQARPWISSLQQCPASAGLPFPEGARFAREAAAVNTEPSTKRASGRHSLDDTDRYVGARVRGRRRMLGLTQHQLAELIGVSYQQANKYETGLNRVSAGRLYRIACLMTSMASAAKMGHHLRAAARRWWEGTGRGIAGRQGRARVRPPLSFPGGLNGYPGVLGPDDKQRTRKRCQAP